MKFKKNRKTALIIGSGVIGAYLSKLLLKKKLNVVVTTRNLKKSYKNYNKLKIQNKVNFVKLNILKKKKIKKIIILVKPDYIFYFAGVSSIIKSFKKPKETLQSNYTGAKNFLEVLYNLKSKIKFFKANSGYIFHKEKIKSNSKLIRPKNPYISSQIKSYKLVKKFRQKLVNSYSLIFFNIESPLRKDEFFIKKICKAVKLINKNNFKKISVGNLSTVRDYGWAPEIVEGIYLSTKLEKACDILFGTGHPMSGENILKFAFNIRRLNYKKYIKYDPKFFRKNEKRVMIAEINETIKKLMYKWKPKIYGRKLILKMYKSF